MIIIPAVDIKAGRCVRLRQGSAADETVYSDHPAEMAAKWASSGAELLHVIDLDGAFEKTLQNLEAIRKILATVSIPVQIGGGIRDEETAAKLIDMGAGRVIIGTEAVERPEFVKTACRDHPGKIVVGIDARQGWVAVDGWTRTTKIRAVELAKLFEDCGVAAINFTDIHRDGTLGGPNIEETARLAESVSIPVVASGGVSSLTDIKNLMQIKHLGVSGVIIGQALYTGAVDIHEALSLVRSVEIKKMQ